MPRIDNERFYKSAIKKYGNSAKGVHWNSEDTQQIRFDAILKMLPDDLHNYTLVDAGCGFGDLYFWMQQKNQTPLSYTGIDTLKDMVEIAQNNTYQKIFQADICKDVLVEADCYVCSGAMNVLDSFETYLFIKNCYGSCGYAFVFNILYGSKESCTYNYVTKKQIYDIARKLDVKTIKIDTNYLKNDMTVAFYKQVDYVKNKT